MQRTIYTKAVSLFVVMCLTLGLFPSAFADSTTGGSEEHTYKYVGERLDKEYDGEPVSLDIKDIEVDGVAGVLTNDNVSVSWYSSGGALNSAPSAAGSYNVTVYLTDMTGAASTIITMDFAIWTKGHTHIFGEWYANDDMVTHSHRCVGNNDQDGCDYEESEPHSYGEWQPVLTHGKQGELQQRVCVKCGYSEERTGIYTVTYDYRTNGGTSAAKVSASAEYESQVDLSPTAVRSGWEFVGWNTDKDAHEALDKVWAERNFVQGDVTLYAIFKKTQNVRFYSQNGKLQAVVPVEVYNNDTAAQYELTEAYPNGLYPDFYEGYEALGWSMDTDANTEIVELTDHIIPDVYKDYYAVYEREITLSYDTDGKYSSWNEVETQYFNSAGNYSEVEFELTPVTATAEVKDFEYWAIGDKEKGEKHKAGETISLKEDATAYAVYTSDLEALPKCNITYDYATNGGTSMTNPQPPSEFSEGETLYTANLGEGIIEEDWDFVGWNTDKNAHEGLEFITVNGDTTLYAIYKKEITAFFHMEDNEILPLKTTLFNTATEGSVTAPSPKDISGWTASGWEKSGDNTRKQYSGTIKISEKKTDFYPVYVKYITLVYDTNGAAQNIPSQSAVIFKRGSEVTTADFTIANAPSREGYAFVSWTLSANSSKDYTAGETATLTEDTVATANWRELEKPRPEEVTVKFNASENGGSITSTTAQQLVAKGGEVDLTAIHTKKEGWEFIGWNTDKNAHEGLASYTAAADVTLYAIYSKSVTATFYSGEEISDNSKETVKAVLWNSDKTATITAPEKAALIEGWTFDGYRSDKHTIEAGYKAGREIPISQDTVFYAVYSREISVGTTTAAKDYTQYSNTAGGVESVTYMLEEPEAEYTEEGGETMRFVGWEVYETSEGEEAAETYTPGTAVTVDANTTVKAKYVKVPAGAALPKVETVGSSVISPTQSLVIKNVTNDDVEGNEIINEGFVYWSKLGDGTKYTVTTTNTHMALEFLAPDTDYYYYAFAENAAGMAKGYIKSFRTEPDGSAPTALTISPEYVSMKKSDKYQLLATLLPVAAENKILWSSSDPSKVEVDENGMLTAKSAGEGIIITATTEVGRLTAECIVDVTEEVTVTETDFSEWHMASHTYNGAANGFDWDTEDADGGNHTIATAYLARWEGAVLEDSDEYPGYDPSDRPSKTVDAQYHIQNIDWLPARTGINSPDPLANDEEIKSALMENGAVYTLMCIDWDCFDDTYANYYCPDEINYNGHAITIVGWDDKYSRDNFTGAYKPSKDGAFICKNSWGEGVGENGYFYISYYDANMGRMDSNAVVLGAESNSNYNKKYDYDPLGAVGYIGMTDTTYAANVFPENGSTLDNTEYLSAVSFYTYHKNTSYTVYIVPDYKDSSSLTKLISPVASGEIKNSGYHTINLNNPVTLNSGTRFAVVVKFDKLGDNSYVYCEFPVAGYSSKARANADESYYSGDGNYWIDLTSSITDANFCIKAFTKDVNAKNKMQLYSAIDNENRPYEADRVYTLDEAEQMGMTINDRYLDFINEKQDSKYKLMSGEAAAVSLGSIPSITKAGGNSVSFVEGARFPSRYNLADMGLVSSVKDQGSWGTCWAHAMYASLESCMLRSAKTTITDAGEKQVILSRSMLTMSENSSMTLAKKITPLGSEDKSVVWTSSDDKVAKVDTNGTIRALKAGAATISATTVSGGVTGRCSVVVEENDVEETVTFEEHSVHKEIGDKFMVAYAVTPMKAELNTYNWISDNTNVATVNENGVITAKANGTAGISIMSGSEVKDTVKVVVGNGFNIETGAIDKTNLTLDGSTLSGKIRVSITNNTLTAQPSSVILTVADANGTALIQSKSPLLTTGANNVEFDNISAENIEGSYTIKCFVWNSLSGMIPISGAADDTAD